MKKRFLAGILLSLVLVTGLIGCGATDTKEVKTEETKTEEVATEEVSADTTSSDIAATEETASTGRTLDQIKESGSIKIGVFSDKNPFGYVDENGEPQGYDVYLAKRIAKDLLGDEKAVEYVFVEAASRVEYLKSGKVDLILANFTVTDERKEQVDFALPYMKVALGVVSPEAKSITDVAQLDGKL